MPARIRRRQHHERRRRLRRALIAAAVAVVTLPLAAVLAGVLVLRASLPRLDGGRDLDGLQAPVTVVRDALGVPDIEAAGRLDAARALGYLHAQDRFFQMDLLRRAAAGELSALIGPATLPSDRDHRRHRFRERARRVLAALERPERAILEAYVEGVDAGLDDLRVRPPEYLLLRQRPEPWRPEDTLLVLYAMFLDLSASTARAEQAWAVVRDELPPALAAFLLPIATRWDAPLQDDPPPRPAGPPDSTLVDVRAWGRDTTAGNPVLAPTAADSAGSNNWAVSGARSGHGGALLANDMHLGHDLPNIWYRARVSWPEGDRRRSVVGVTLPGTPAVVAGSNGDLAWGFTNSYGDWADLVVLETDSTGAVPRYRTPDGWRAFTTTAEVIAVAGAAPDTLTITGTIWGPVWAHDTAGRPLALRWTAHDAEAVNLTLLRLETAGDVDAAVALAGQVGIPAQNLVCADRTGRIAWTIAGRIPRRVGWDGRLPVSWADGTRRWDGYLDPAEQPRLVDPAEGLLWTANNRVTAGRDLAVIGDGGYELPARARQIHDALRALEGPVEEDMLALQLDDRALLLGEWRDLLLPALERRTAELDERQAEFLRIVRDRWEGRAVPSSVSYRLVRQTIGVMRGEIYGLLTGPCAAADEDFDPAWLPHGHAIAWTLLTERPANLLPPGCRDWDDLVLRSVSRVMEAATGEDRPVREHTWGAVNVVRVEHPLARALPWLKGRLAAPARALPGDAHMPRVQGRRSGASQRLVVSPGRERDGILHMPGGQSGHPLSPYFLAGHEDWAEGRPTPLLPGAPRHRLVLRPAD